MKQIKPMLAVILAGALWGVISLFVRHLNAAGLDVLQISLVRMAVGSLVLGAAAAFRGGLRVRLKDLWIFAGTGIVSIVLFNSFYFYTMLRGEASVAVVLLYTSPAFILILSAIFFKERITARKTGALILTLIGCVLVSGVLSGTARLSPLLLATGLASGLCYGLYSIFGKFALDRYDPLTVTAYSFFFGLLGSLPFGRVGETVRLTAADPALLWWMAGIGVVSTVLPYLLYTWGLKRLEPSRAGILVAVEPVVGAILGIAAYGESRDLWKIIGILLVIGAIILLNTGENHDQSGIH